MDLAGGFETVTGRDGPPSAPVSRPWHRRVRLPRRRLPAVNYIDRMGHSGYWDEHSQSLRNQALVVVGKGNAVALQPPPDPWAHVK
jgi:hypothetical protein